MFIDATRLVDPAAIANTESDMSEALILEADDLESHLRSDHLAVIDLSKRDTHLQYHVPGAMHLEYAQLLEVKKPVMGLLPDPAKLDALFGDLGLSPNAWVVAYDDEGGGKAARLLWTLAAHGHSRISLLNGGLHAWAKEGHPMDSGLVAPTPAPYKGQRNEDVIADRHYILDHLEDPSVALLDTRSKDEFDGVKRYARRGGHIPGAVNLDWLRTMDQSRNLRLLPEAQLRLQLEQRDVTPDREVVVYCQSHHRSAHTFVVLKSLGYPRVRGYHGAWSEWGNDPQLPLET